MYSPAIARLCWLPQAMALTLGRSRTGLMTLVQVVVPVPSCPWALSLGIQKQNRHYSVLYKLYLDLTRYRYYTSPNCSSSIEYNNASTLELSAWLWSILQVMLIGFYTSSTVSETQVHTISVWEVVSAELYRRKAPWLGQLKLNEKALIIH